MPLLCGLSTADDEPAMYAPKLLQAAREAAYSTEMRSVDENTPLSAREVCQVSREVTFERRTMTKVGQASWNEIYAGHFVVSVEGWQISIYNDCDKLDYCEECFIPDGRRWSFDSGARFGTDPIALLSTWEHQTLERLLKYCKCDLQLRCEPCLGGMLSLISLGVKASDSPCGLPSSRLRLWPTHSACFDNFHS
jgi:hypothetical protein